MNEQEQTIAEKLVALLKSCRERPEMYCISNVHEWLAFQTGLTFTYEIVGLGLSHHKDAYLRRGWKRAADGGVDQMRQRGMNDGEIIREFIDIELDELKAAMSS